METEKDVYEVYMICENCTKKFSESLPKNSIVEDEPLRHFVRIKRNMTDTYPVENIVKCPNCNSSKIRIEKRSVL